MPAVKFQQMVHQVQKLLLDVLLCRDGLIEKGQRMLPFEKSNYFLTRSTYSPVRVSIFTRSPSLIKIGTAIS